MLRRAAQERFMTPIDPNSLDARTMRLIQLGFLVWAAIWIGLAAATAYEFYVLHDLGNTLTKTGSAVETAGKALQVLGNVPFVGGEVQVLADQTRAAGESAVASGRSTRATTTELAVLIGAAIAFMPTLPVLVLYLPLRAAWRRERRAVTRAVHDRAGDGLLEEYLANRAVANLPYAELRSVSPQPWVDLRSGRFGALAQAELRRLGIAEEPAP
jgi:hypothetical protein